MVEWDRGSARTLIRAALIFVGILAVIATIGATVFGSRPTGAARAAVDRFTDALAHRDAAGAAALTSYPNAAAASIEQLFRGLAPGKADYRLVQLIELDESSAFFTVDANWHFGKGREWSYRVKGSARKLAVGWRILWNPEVLVPGMTRGRTVRLVRTDAPAARVRDVRKMPLMARQPIAAVWLDPAKTSNRAAAAAAIARVIEPVAPLITRDVVLRKLEAAQGKPIIAVTLRAEDYSILEPTLVEIPGVVVHEQDELLTVDRRMDSPALEAMRTLWHRDRDRTAGWAVQMYEFGRSVTRLAGRQGPAPADLVSTLSPRVQLAAQDAVVDVGTAATIVAIRPSTGAVLAVAQNNQADASGPIAFTRTYPIGRDFAQWGSAVAWLGIGADLSLPGIEAVTGKLRRPSQFETVSHVSGSRDVVQASNYGMAVATATVARGEMPYPKLVDGAAKSGRKLPDDLVAGMRGMFGKFRDIPGLHDVRGYTTEVNGDQWFLGYRGDLAFAVHIDKASDYSSDEALRMAVLMMRGLDRAS